MLHIIEDLNSAGGINPPGAEFARTFAKRHDAGYGSDLNILSTTRAKHILGQTLEAIDSPVPPHQLIDFIQDNQSDYLIARIIGHGAVGVVENSIYFHDQLRLSREKSLGIASVLAAHHPGFPITMVSGFAKKPIPRELRSSLFIDDNGSNPEDIRYKLARFGADQLEISHSDAFKAAAFGYALDRVTAASPPEAIVLENDQLKVIGGEVVQKKYGLIVRDLRGDKSIKDPSIETLYSYTMSRLKEELKAALHTVHRTKDPALLDYFNTLGERQLQKTHTNQAQALAQLGKYKLTGSFSKVPHEYNILLQRVKETNDPQLLYALATYDCVLQN